MPVTAVLVAPAVQLAPLARMRLRLWAGPVGPAEMPAWPVMVPRVWLVLTALWCRGMVAPVAAAVLVALAETAVLVEQAGSAVLVPVRVAVLVWRPPGVPVVSAASAVRALMHRL